MIEDTGDNVIAYYYDKLNRVTDIANGSTYATIEYATCCSIRTKMTLGNGCYTEYTYDDAKRLTRIANKKSNGTVISAWDYTYDDVGNVLSQTDADTHTTSYSYDDIYQLSHVDYPSGSDFGYEYDGVGNRLKMHEYTTSTITTTYTYDSADELTQYTTSTLTVSFGYASDGCLVSKSDGADTYEYVWDLERHLAAFKKNGYTLVEYGYNPTGTRRQTSDSTLGVENYFYSGAHALADYDSAWGMTRSYILGPSVEEIICVLDPTAEPSSAFYVVVDGLGSSREVVTSGQTPVTRYDYDRWGYPTEQKLVGDTSIRYLGAGEADDRTGCYSKGSAPSYDPAVGRCIQMARQPPDRWDRGNGYVGMPDWDSLVMWVDPTAGCIDWCDENLQKCLSESCDVLGWCSDAGHGWQKAPCYRCCRCYFKRCYLQCLGDAKGGRRVRAMYGPPSKCRNDNSATKCAESCFADHYNVLPYGDNIKCDDDPAKLQGEPGLTWLSICQSDDWVYEEYGMTTGLDWQEDGAYYLNDPFHWYCHYSDARGIQCGGEGTGKTATCTFRVAKGFKCPSRFPLAMGGHHYYWPDWEYWTRAQVTYEPGPGGNW